MTQITNRAPAQTAPFFDTISGLLMGAIIVAAGALSFVAILTA
jgi:hypothetical protein